MALSGAWGLIKNGADYAVKIDDKYAKQAMCTLYFPTPTDKRIISGGSGAGGFAWFIAIMSESDFKTVKESLGIGPNTSTLIISTEGDTD